ncbi:hypothetical protein pb186bvf_002921 [Paramecium bursaria]
MKISLMLVLINQKILPQLGCDIRQQEQYFKIIQHLLLSMRLQKNSFKINRWNYINHLLRSIIIRYKLEIVELDRRENYRIYITRISFKE